MERRAGSRGWGRGIVLLLGFLLLAACGVDAEQERICRLVLDAVKGGRATEVAVSETARPRAVRLAYRIDGDEGGITCLFAGSGFDRDKTTVTGVEVDGQEPLTAIRVHMLRQWLAMFDPRRVRTAEEAPDPPPGLWGEALPALLYPAQLFANALVVGAIYGLLALGFTLVYGLVQRINFAFGEMATLGAYTAYFAAVATTGGGWPLMPILVAGIAAAMAMGTAWGWAMERQVFRPLARARGYAPLVAALGLAIALREYYRLAQGAGDLWLPPILDRRITFAEGPDVDLTLATGQIAILVLVALLYAGTALLYRRSSYGRLYRAAADDPFAAALMGVDLRRVAASTFAVASALAAAGGAVLLLRYGGANFFMGLLLGFKALTAAVLGGIGSRRGAVVGGVLIALFEAFWTGYFPIGYRDVAVFGILAAVIVLRPQGLFGIAPSIQYRAPDRYL